MKANFKALRLEQLTRQLGGLARPALRERPSQGWIRAVRDALGMSTYQLARRIGVSQPTLANWEQREAKGTISLQSLRRVAAAMECDLVYVLAPRKALKKILEQRALQVAARSADRVAHSMDLEGQGTSTSRGKKNVQTAARRLLGESPKRLWDD